jgi:hypothetical protein
MPVLKRFKQQASIIVATMARRCSGCGRGRQEPRFGDAFGFEEALARAADAVNRRARPDRPHYALHAHVPR